MRTRALASLLVLCGSTAALAQMTPQAPPQTPPTQESIPQSGVDDAMNNQTTTTEPTMPDTTTAPDSGTSEPAPNSTDTVPPQG